MLISNSTVKALHQVRQNVRITRSRRNVTRWLQRELVPPALGRTVAAR